MPARSPSRHMRLVQSRARYARTNGNMLTAASYSDMGVDPSGQPPAVWWMGLDSGGGSYPVGPNGPWTGGVGPALPVVTRATSLITGPLTAAPFRVQDLGFGGHALGRPRWVTDPMLLRPDDRVAGDVFPAAAKLPRGSFWTDWVRSAIWYGVGAFLCQEDLTGQPLAGTMRLVHPGLLSCERSTDDGSLRWVLGGTAADERVVFDRDGYLQLGPVTYRLVTLRNPHSPVDVDGHSMGVFEANPQAFRLAGQVDTYASGTFRSGIPAGYLKVDQTMSQMTQEQADQLKSAWMNAHGGDRRSIAVLNAFTTFTPLNLSPVDAALGEVKRLNIGDVAFAFALDPLTLGVSLGNSATYNNLRDAWTNHKDFGLAPWIAAVEDTLTALLPGSQGVKVDLDKFANPPPGERFAAYQTAITSGVLTVDECRELEGLEPLPEPPLVPTPVPLTPEPVAPAPVDAPGPVDPGVDPVPAAHRDSRPQPWR